MKTLTIEGIDKKRCEEIGGQYIPEGNGQCRIRVRKDRASIPAEVRAYLMKDKIVWELYVDNDFLADGAFEPTDTTGWYDYFLRKMGVSESFYVPPSRYKGVVFRRKD